MAEADKLGYPLVMKVVGPVHKSDVGGVVLNVKDKETVAREFNRMILIPETTAILMQPMLSGTELYVGATCEDKFGHMILCGMGGDLYRSIERCSGLLWSPVVKSEAMQMIHNLKSYKNHQGGFVGRKVWTSA